MRTAKVAITLDEDLLKRLDLLVKNRMFENRSLAIQEAVSEKLVRLERGRLARECAKLDRNLSKRWPRKVCELSWDIGPKYV
jgi:metal-responsive CopG/Arc/MetJ family transcriptional regulator